MTTDTDKDAGSSGAESTAPDDAPVGSVDTRSGQSPAPSPDSAEREALIARLEHNAAAFERASPNVTSTKIDFAAAQRAAKTLREAAALLRELSAELSAEQAKSEQYRAALRKRAIFGASHLMACGECGTEWQENQNERHAPDCLAAP